MLDAWVVRVRAVAQKLIHSLTCSQTDFTPPWKLRGRCSTLAGVPASIRCGRMGKLQMTRGQHADCREAENP